MTPRAGTESVRAVYEAERGRLGRALLAFSGSTDVAEEAMAEAFAQLLRRGEAVRDQRAWVWRAAFRIAAGDLQRRRANGTIPLDGHDLRAWSSGGADVGAAADLVRDLAGLTDQQRRCVVLVYIADLSAVDAARVLDTSPATVRVQLMRARARLRMTLSHEEHDDA